MSQPEQLPLPYEPPEISGLLDDLKAILREQGGIRAVSEQLLAAYEAFEDGRIEGMETLKEILKRSEYVEWLVAVVQAAIVEVARQREAIRIQRNEAVRDRNQLLRALYGTLLRFQRKAGSA